MRPTLVTIAIALCLLASSACQKHDTPVEAPPPVIDPVQPQDSFYNISYSGSMLTGDSITFFTTAPLNEKVGWFDYKTYKQGLSASYLFTVDTVYSMRLYYANNSKSKEKKIMIGAGRERVYNRRSWKRTYSYTENTPPYTYVHIGTEVVNFSIDRSGVNDLVLPESGLPHFTDTLSVIFKNKASGCFSYECLPGTSSGQFATVNYYYGYNRVIISRQMLDGATNRIYKLEYTSQ